MLMYDNILILPAEIQSYISSFMPREDFVGITRSYTTPAGHALFSGAIKSTRKRLNKEKAEHQCFIKQKDIRNQLTLVAGQG